MQKALVFLLLLGFTSCEYFNAKKIASEDILKEELKTFNWNDVDAYPTFSSCDSSLTKEDRKQCFESTLSNFISGNLQTETIIVSQDINDTIILDFQISETGILHLKTVKVDSVTKLEIPKIEELLKQSLDSLPRIFPAIKRNQPVKTEFKLPIIIVVN